MCLINLAYSTAISGDPDRAEPLLKRALAIRQQKLGENNRYTTEPLLNLAWIQYSRGNYAQAESTYLRVLQVLEQTLGPIHPELVTILSHLAMLYEAQGQISKAVAAQKRSSEMEEYYLGLSLSQGTEEQKLLYLHTLRGETYGTISLHLRSAPNDLDAARLALTTILRRKGRMLDVMSDSIGVLRRRFNPEDVTLLDQLTAARSQLATLLLNASDRVEPEQRKSMIGQLEAEIARLETSISARSAEFRAFSGSVTIEQVQESIPRGAVLLEFVSYQPFQIKAGDNSAWDNPHYAIYLLQHEGPPKWIDLGDGTAIDADVERFRTALRDPARTDVKMIGRSLDEKIMRPVRMLIGTARQLLIAPDAALNLIPFAALVDERNKYLVEDYSISYLTSGRDLLRLRSTFRAATPATIVANPSYDLKNNANVKTILSAGRRSVDFTALTYSPLPGTMEEAAEIKTQIPDAQVLVKEQATEAAVKRLQSPQILHIATHGFFLTAQRTKTGPRDFRQLVSDNEVPGNAETLENPYCVRVWFSPVSSSAQVEAMRMAC